MWNYVMEFIRNLSTVLYRNNKKTEPASFSHFDGTNYSENKFPIMNDFVACHTGLYRSFFWLYSHELWLTQSKKSVLGEKRKCVLYWWFPFVFLCIKVLQYIENFLFISSDISTASLKIKHSHRIRSFDFFLWKNFGFLAYQTIANSIEYINPNMFERISGDFCWFYQFTDHFCHFKSVLLFIYLDQTEMWIQLELFPPMPATIQLIIM